MLPPSYIHSVYPYRYSYIDKTGKVVVDAGRYQRAASFSEGLAAVLQAEQGWGYIDRAGRVVIPPQFEEAGEFSEGLAAVQLGGEWGYIDKTGRVLIRPQYDKANGFSEGVAVAVKDNEFFLIDQTGQTVLSRSLDVLQPNVYEKARFSDGLLEALDAAKLKYGYIDRAGKFVIEPKYGEAAPFSEGLARVSVTEGGEEKVGFIDRQGRFVIPPKFNTDADFRRNSTDFSEGLASLTENLRPTVTEEEKFVYIDKRGGIVLATDFFYAGPFNDGLAVAYDAERGKWGFIDKSGKVAVPLRYDLAEAFSEALACVAVRSRKSRF